MLSDNLTKAAFQLKGGACTVTILQLLQGDLYLLDKQMLALLKKTPQFFNNTPLIIDLERITNKDVPIDFITLKALLLKHGLIPVAVRNGSDLQNQTAVNAGLGVLTLKDTAPAVNPKNTITTTSKLINQPIRSGQQIYAQDTDLIILNSVSPGAEVLADGNIHVYGNLQGRALAGVMGNTRARIFCKKLSAELIAIAGHYKLSDDIEPIDNKNGVQIYLEENELKITAL